VALLAGGALLGYLYGHSMVWVVAFSLTAEVLALTVLRLVADTPLRGHS